MTAPVPVYEQKPVAGGRRTRGGCFYIPPIPPLREAILYIFIFHAIRHKIDLWAVMIMSNHLHWAGFDNEGRYPDFIREVHQRITEVVMHYYGLTGRMWSGDRPVTKRLEGTTLAVLLYIVTNAVKDGLVDYSDDWKGLIIHPELAGETIRARCPEVLRERYPKTFPETLSYEVPIPTIYADLPAHRVHREFARARRDHEVYLRSLRPEGYVAPGDAALEVTPDQRPAAPPESTPFRCFSAATREIERACWSDLDRFRGDYGRAVEVFNAGKRDVEWPYGTYARHRWHRCPRCNRAP